MKKFTQVAVAAGLAVALSSSAFAGGYTRAEMPVHHCGVTGLGVSLFSSIGGTGNKGFLDFGHDLNMGLSYVMNPWEMGLSFGGSTNDNNSAYRTRAYFGHRWALMHCLFGSVGVNGGYFHKKDTSPEYTDTYDAGAYVGLSYEPSQHFALFTRINAVNWSTTLTSNPSSDNGSNWNFFNSGVVGMSYYFGDFSY